MVRQLQADMLNSFLFPAFHLSYVKYLVKAYNERKWVHE